jgi:hypothetical protein
MPVTYAIDAQERVIRTRCIGMVTLAEVVGHFRELERDPDCVGRLDVLLDLSETNSLPRTQDIQAIPNELARIREKIRFEACAIVASTDALFGMLRMFEVLAERYFRVIHVFRSGRRQRRGWCRRGSGLLRSRRLPREEQAQSGLAPVMEIRGGGRNAWGLWRRQTAGSALLRSSE